jgi:hypothetical protein
MKTVAVFALFMLAAAGGFAQTSPEPPEGIVELQGRTQLIANIGDVDLMVEGLGRSEHVDTALQSLESLTVGGYYRLLKNMKIGAFYRLQAGAHHDSDWAHIPISAPPWWEWGWKDASSRLEHLLMLDVSPRFLLDFLPGQNWVLMLKGRYIYNTFENQMSILARPELTWFWIQDRVPLLNVSLSYEAYFPLNFGETLLYQGYPYVNLLWHASPDWMLELGGAYKTTAWSTTEGLVYFNCWVVALGVIYNLSF